MDNELRSGTFATALPQALRQRLCSLWIKFFEMLTLSCVPSTSMNKFLNGFQLRQAFSLHGEGESWEKVLLALTETDAVIKFNDLKLQPIFYSLPIIVQTRFLFLVQYNASRISNYHLNTFVTKLESVESVENSWVKAHLGMLRHYLNVEQSGNIISECADQTKSTSYEFSPASKAILCNTPERLKSQSATGATASHSHNTSITLTVSALPNHHETNSESNHICRSAQKVVDVIVIDDDDGPTEDDNIINDPNYRTGSVFKSNEGKNMVNKNLDTSVTSIDSNADATISRENKHKVHHLKEPLNTADKEAVSSTCEPVAKVPKLAAQEPDEEGKTTLGSDKLIIARSQDRSKGHETLPFLTDNLKINLEKLKEACFGEKKHSEMDTNKLNFLLNMSPAEIESACIYLELSDQTEETLVSVCDCMPWAEMEYDAASALFTGCVFHKLSTTEVQVSQTLVTAMRSVLKGQPKAVLDLLVKVIHATQSNECQCQLLAILCKDAFSQEWLCYLVRQLSQEPIVTVTENLVTVLQAVLDRRVELDPMTLTSLLGLLTTGCQNLAQSPKFGKCLMACLTKYGKKMTAENLTSFTSLVDTHGSNFKAALSAALKRINR